MSEIGRLDLQFRGITVQHAAGDAAELVIVGDEKFFLVRVLSRHAHKFGGSQVR